MSQKVYLYASIESFLNVFYFILPYTDQTQEGISIINEAKKSGKSAHVQSAVISLHRVPCLLFNDTIDPNGSGIFSMDIITCQATLRKLKAGMVPPTARSRSFIT